MDFLDYCLLNIAQKLGMADGHAGYIQLAIRTEVDFPDGLVDEFLRHGSSLSVGGAKCSFDKHQFHHGHGFSAQYGKSWRGAHQPGIGWATAVNGDQRLGVGFITDRDYEETDYQGSRDSVHTTFQTSVRTKLDQFKMQIQDEACAKLTKLGVPLLEREEMKAILEERDLADSNEFETRSCAQMTCATHMVIIDIGPGQQRDTCRISVRLASVDRGQILWSDAQEQLLRDRAPANHFLLDSGRLAVLNPSSRDSSREFLPLTPKASSRVLLSQPRLVYQESCMDAGEIRIRDLFTAAPLQVPSSRLSAGNLRGMEGLEDVPRSNMMRYVVWRVARTVMPRAGLVTSVDRGLATLSLGEDGGTQPGDKFHVLRVSEAGDVGSGGLIQHVLPVEMVAREVSEKSTVATFTDTGLDLLWSDTIEIKPGDVVRPRAAYPSRLHIAPATVQTPPRDVARLLRLDNPVRRAQVLTDTQHASHLLAKKLQDAFIGLGIQLQAPAAVMGSSDPLLPSGTASPIDLNGSESFVIRSSISPRTGDFFEINLQLASIDREQPVDSLSFRVKTRELRDWVP
jgi:hypothetical protein